jgi:hypothetical protein
VIEFLIGAALAVGKAYDVPGRTRAYAVDKKNDLVAKTKAAAGKVPGAARNKAGQWTAAAGATAGHWYSMAGERLVVQAERFEVWAPGAAQNAVGQFQNAVGHYQAKWAGVPFVPAQAQEAERSRSRPAAATNAPKRPPGPASTARPAGSSSSGSRPARPSAPAAGQARPAAAGNTGLPLSSLPYPNPAPYRTVTRPGFDLPVPRPTPPAPVPYQRNPMDYSPASRAQALTDVNNYADFKISLAEFQEAAYDNLEMAQLDLARSNAWAAHLDTVANALRDRGFDAATIAEVRVLAEHAKAEAAAQQGVAAAAAGTFAAAFATHQNVSARWDVVAGYVAELESLPNLDFFRS